MFKENDIVVYGSQGVCRVGETAQKVIKGKSQEYYVLYPISRDNSAIFVPKENPVLLDKIRNVLSLEEIKILIKTLPESEYEWIEDDFSRRKKFREALSSGDRKAVASVIKSLYNEQQRRKAEKKKLAVSDEILLKQAEDLLYGELALVLNIKPEEVVPFLEKELSCK